MTALTFQSSGPLEVSIVFERTLLHFLSGLLQYAQSMVAFTRWSVAGDSADDAGEAKSASQRTSQHRVSLTRS